MGAGAPTGDSGVSDGGASEASRDASANEVIDGAAEGSAGGCGTGGTDCLGGPCAGGQCQAFAFWTSDAGVVPRALAQDESFLYWADQVSWVVARTEKSTGATTILYVDSERPESVAVDDAGIYWGNYDGIERCLKSGCPDAGPALVATVAHPDGVGVFSLAIDDSRVYWTEDTGDVYFAHKYGTAETPTPLWQGQASVNALVTDGQQVYFACGDGVLRVVGVDGGAPRAFGQAGQASSNAVAIDTDTVFWTIGDPTDTVLAAGKNSSATVGNTLASSQDGVEWIASDGLDLYWADVGLTSTIVQCAIGDCQPATVASGLNIPSAIVVDDVAVYWTNTNAGSNGTLWKIAK
jgi:hypothetical protein